MKLKILGHEYEIKFDPKLDKEHGAFGTHCGGTLTILIDNSFPQSHQEESLIHEFIEAINFNLGLKLEHQQIIALSSGLFQIFKDNNLINFKEVIKDATQNSR